MPVILTSEQIERWLDHADEDEHVMTNYGLDWQDRLRAHKVRPFGFRENGRELVRPLEAFQA